MFVEDHCSAIDLIVRKANPGEIYNIGGHNEHSNLEVVKTILETLGKPESLITFVGDRKGHDLRYAIDPAKIKNDLGWEPKTMCKDGIRSTINWYLENRQWWENILSGEYQKYNSTL